jgi:hypothetical protein
MDMMAHRESWHRALEGGLKGGLKFNLAANVLNFLG